MNTENKTMILTLNLTDFALRMGYSIDTNPSKDTNHSGYTKNDILKMNLKFDNIELSSVDKIFPTAVANALEDAERDAYCVASRKFRLEALKKTLLLINWDYGMKYSKINSSQITDVVIDEANDSLKLTILNPIQLINEIVDTVGRREIPLSDESSVMEIEKNCIYLLDFFECSQDQVFSGEVQDSFIPNTDYTYFEELVKESIANLELADIVEEIAYSIDHSDLETKDLINIAETLTKFKASEINFAMQQYYISMANKFNQ